MKKTILTFLFGSIVALAQQQTVSQFFYDGSGNQRYICTAPANLPYQTSVPVTTSIQPPAPVSIASGTLTNITVSGGTATVTVSSTSPWNAGTYAEMQIVVSGSATAALNGGYTITSNNTNTTTFVFTTTAGNATYTDANLKISTNNPLLIQAAWQLVVFSFNTSNQTTGAYTANAGYSFPCSGRSNY
jgi:hypothetical protein